MISMRMLKICSRSIIKPLQIFINNGLRMFSFPRSGRKQILLLSIKNDKQVLKNYRPISPLLICSKVLKSLLYNSVFKFLSKLTRSHLISSVLRKMTLCINEIISIIHKIQEWFYEGFEVWKHFSIYWNYF